MNEDLYYARVGQITALTDLQQVNALLDQGWILIRVSETSQKFEIGNGKAKLGIVPVYVLGGIRQQPSPIKKDAKLSDEPSSTFDPVVRLEALPWAVSTFSDEVDSIPPDKIPSEIASFLRGKAGKLRVPSKDPTYFEIEYHLTKSGWLNRRKIKPK
jgi:hypothetical protein